MIETGISFGNIHSFYDLDLILSVASIAPAIPKTNYIDIPGGDGSLDLTEALGDVKFSDRVHTFTLTMNPAGDLSEKAWERKKMEVSNLLNGRSFKITLDKDPDYYWVGRCAIDNYASEMRIRQFEISATVRPYKLKQSETIKVFALSPEGNEIFLHNGRKSVCPVITCTESNTTVEFNGNTYTLGAGTFKNLDIRLTEGDNKMFISGTGKVTFTYQEGEL